MVAFWMSPSIGNQQIARKALLQGASQDFLQVFSLAVAWYTDTFDQINKAVVLGLSRPSRRALVVVKKIIKFGISFLVKEWIVQGGLIRCLRSNMDSEEYKIL